MVPVAARPQTVENSDGEGRAEPETVGKTDFVKIALDVCARLRRRPAT